MGELLSIAGWQLYDQIISPDDRAMLEKQLAEPTQLQVAEGRGEARIPWEFVYDGLPSSSNRPGRKTQRTQETAVFDPDNFWGFKHIIERSDSRYGRKSDMLYTEMNTPIFLTHIGSDTPDSVTVDQSIRNLADSGSNSKEHQALASLDDFFASFGEASNSPRLYILRSKAGTDQGETWISFGFDATGKVNLSELRRQMSLYFNTSEIQVICFDLNIDYDDLSGDSKNSKILELITYAQRRGILDELVAAVQRLRPHMRSEELSRSQLRLTRRELESRSVKAQLNAVLILDVDAGLVQAEDWSAWLSLFYKMGFVGVLAPTTAPDLKDSWPFMEQFIQQFLSGVPIGEALREARHWLWQEKKDPRGLIYAYFGSTNLSLHST